MSGFSYRTGRRVFNIYTLSSVCLLLALLAIRVVDPSPVEFLRLSAFDFYQRIKPLDAPIHPMAPVIVAIDEPSLKELGPMPWSRAVFSRLTEKLGTAEPAVIVFDALFAEPDRMSPAGLARSTIDVPDRVRRTLAEMPDGDRLFADAIGKVRVVLGQAGYWRETTGDDREPLKVRISYQGHDPRAFAPHLRSMIRNIPLLERPATGHGLIVLLTDADSITRRMPTVFVYKDRLYPSLAIEALRVAFSAGAVRVHGTEIGIRALSVREDRWVSTDRYGRIWPQFSISDPRRYVSARAVLAGEVDDGVFRDRIVLVGATAVALGDTKTTPVDRNVPGVEVHAQTIDAILSGAILVRPSYIDVAELTLVFLIGIITIAVVSPMPARWSLAGILAIVGVIGSVSWVMFAVDRLLLDPVFPTITVFTVYLIDMIARSVFLEQRGDPRQGG